MARARENLRATFELFDLAVAMQAERYRREHPDATDEEVAAAVQAWILDRPGAPDGDAVGRRVSLPRSR